MNWLNFFRITGYGLLFLGVICTIVVDYLKNKSDERMDISKNNQMTELIANVKESKKILEPFQALASKLYPTLTHQDALEKLKERMDSLDQEITTGKEKVSALSAELAVEKNTIKSFEASVYIKFSGKWNAAPYPVWYQSPQPMTFIEWIDNSNKIDKIDFSSSKISFNTIDSKTATFENILTVQTGKKPLGQMTDILSGYDQMNFWFLFTNPKNLSDPIVTIDEIKITFLVNGIKSGELYSNSPQAINLKDAIEKADNATPFINPMLSLKGKLVKILNFKDAEK